MKKSCLSLIIVLAVGFSLGGCATKVERVSREQKIDISGKWNDYDAYLTSKEMIEDCLKSAWLGRFVDNVGRNPRVIVGHVSNRSHEHINTEVFTKSLEKELTNSGRVVFVASSMERAQIRSEREDQMEGGYTDLETIKRHGKEKGADLMLIGSVNSVIDALKSKSAVFYQVNLELINLETNEKIWIGQKELKKRVTKAKISL